MTNLTRKEPVSQPASLARHHVAAYVNSALVSGLANTGTSHTPAEATGRPGTAGTHNNSPAER